MAQLRQAVDFVLARLDERAAQIDRPVETIFRKYFRW